MKTKETKTSKDWLAEATERIDRTQPIIKSRYYAVEVTPAKRTPWHDDSGCDWTDPRARVCSGYYDTKEEVKVFLEKFEPDEGNHFVIRKQNLRQFTQWVNY